VKWINYCRGAAKREIVKIKLRSGIQRRTAGGHRSFTRRGRRGFTLVEVIVVLAIIAILAATATPSLAGYIDKVDTKQHILDARDKAVAVRSVMAELYATGALNEEGESVLCDDDRALIVRQARALDKYNSFSIETDSEDIYSIYKEAAKLMGTTYTVNGKNTWLYYPVGSIDSTIWNTNGFVHLMFPDGHGTGGFEPVIMVTNKLKRMEGLDRETPEITLIPMLNGMVYDADAGYEVYIMDHCKFPGET
jgi:prepilin-type N-terminal cleavage/methylation domain-containing protein